MTQPSVRAVRLVLRFDDYVWFASHEWGGDNETAPVLHGFALSFALSGTERFAPGFLPRYNEDLEPLDVYCTPARLLSSHSFRQRAAFTFNSVDEPTQLTQALGIGEKVNDPKIGKRQVLVPGLRFEAVAFTRNGFQIPRVFRLGKKRAPVVREAADEISGRPFQSDDDMTPSHAVSPLDVKGIVTMCRCVCIPPHMVYEEATIRGDEFVRDGQFVAHVPTRVRSWRSA